MSSRLRVLVLVAIGLVIAVLGVWVAIVESPSESDSDSSRARERARARDMSTDDHARPAPRESVRAGEPDHEDIAGRVIDREDGPLAEGSVALACPDGTSLGRVAIGEDGWFEAPACPDSPTCVRLIHPSSVQARGWRLDAGEAVELEVDPAPRVAGTVLADGRAIAAARVVARRGDRRWTASTDVTGAFALPLGERPDGANACEFEPPRVDDQPFALLVLAPGHRPWTASVPAAGDEALDILLAEPAAPMTGSLRDPEGRSFDRARVLATSRDRPDEAHAAHPDASGRFEFGELGEGVYRLRAIRDGVELVRADGQAGADVVMVATLPARGPTLELTLRDDRGEPTPGVRVDGGPFRSAHTDEAGQVMATDVFAGGYDLRLRAPEPDLGAGCGVSRERIEVPATAQDWTIRVDLSLACEPDESTSSTAPLSGL
jgi:hypothetical protein